VPEQESYEQYQPPTEARREDGSLAHANAKRVRRSKPFPAAASHEAPTPERQDKRDHAPVDGPEPAVRASRLRRSVRNWALCIIIPPLLVFGSIIVFGWGGGWSQLVGATHAVTAHVLGEREVGDCGSKNIYTKQRLELEWKVADGSVRTGRVDHCTDGGSYSAGDGITVWVDHDDNVATDQEPWLTRGMGLLFTVILWSALLWQWHDNRKPKPVATRPPKKGSPTRNRKKRRR